MREIRLLVEQELQGAANIANEVFEVCLRNKVTEQECSRFTNYIKIENLMQGVQQGQLFVWGCIEDGQLCGIGAIQSDGLLTILSVRTYFQNRGIGSGLLNAMRYSANTFAANTFATDTSGVKTMTAYVTPVVMAPFFYKRGFELLPGGAAGDGYVVVGCELGMQNQTSSTAVPKVKFEGAVYPKKKVPTKMILWVTAIVLVIGFALISGITIHHLATEKMYTAEDLYQTEDGNK